MLPDNQSADPGEVQLAKAFAIASEANRTLQEAREAVRQVQQSQGYCAPESTSGKGHHATCFFITYGFLDGEQQGTGKGKTGKGYGSCFTCGMRGHGYQQCPDRFGKGKGKSKNFGKFNGKKASPRRV